MSDSNRAMFVEKIIRHDLETILDIRAGTGVFTIPLARNAGRVVAIELCRKAREEGLSRIKCINRA